MRGDPQMPVEEQLRRFGFSWDSCNGFGVHMDWWGFYETLVAAAPRGSTIVEIGCYTGQSLFCLSSFAAESGKGLHIVGVDDNTMGGNQELKKNIPFIRRSSINGNPPVDLKFIEKPSVEAAKYFADGSVLCAFIDGGHLHDIVESDIRAWMPKVSKHGWLCGHDFMMYTVHQPVLNMFPTTTIFDERWDDVWIVPKQELPGPVDIRLVPEKYPDRTRWKP